MRAAIFDADGTLIDSMPVWDNVCTDYISSFGIIPDNELEEEIITMSFADSCSYCIDHYGLNKSVGEMIEDISAMVADKYRSEVPLKKGAADYLKKLADERIKMCVVTASERGYITDCLKRLGVYDYFDFVMTCTEEGLDKNSSAIYDRAAQRLGADKEDVIVFEDAYNAMKAAKKGGYRVYGIYDKSMDKYRAEVIQSCDRYILTYKELL